MVLPVALLLHCLLHCRCAGEVHLETCIKDLKERFARVELVVSPPLVAFRCAAGTAGQET